jgi:hypothetical protein
LASVVPQGTGKVLVPFPESMATTPTATHCRTTVLIASLQALKRHKWFDVYKRAIDPQVLDVIETTVAGSWLPLDIAAAHYTTCDSLGISVHETLEIGGEVIMRLQQTLLGTLVRVARSTGAVTPLTVLTRFNQLHARSWIGSGGRVMELGKKDVRLDVAGLSLVHIPYFRASYRGFLRAGARFFAERAVVTEVPEQAGKDGISFRFTWV